MWTPSKDHLLCVCAVALMLGAAPIASWAETLAMEEGEATDAGKAQAMNKCESASSPIGRALLIAEPTTSPGEKPDKPVFRITSVDPKEGKVTAEHIENGQTVEFRVDPEVRTRSVQPLNVGSAIGFGFISKNGIGGKCPCGQRSDGSCWCSCDYCVEACCMGCCTHMPR